MYKYPHSSEMDYVNNVVSKLFCELVRSYDFGGLYGGVKWGSLCLSVIVSLSSYDNYQSDTISNEAITLRHKGPRLTPPYKPPRS